MFVYPAFFGRDVPVEVWVYKISEVRKMHAPTNTISIMFECLGRAGLLPEDVARAR